MRMRNLLLSLLPLFAFSSSAATAQPVPEAIRLLTKCMSEIFKNSSCSSDEITFDSNDQFESFANNLRSNKYNLQSKILTYDQRFIQGEQLLKFSVPGLGNRDSLYFSANIVARQMPIRVKSIQQLSFDDFINSMDIPVTEFDIPN